MSDSDDSDDSDSSDIGNLFQQAQNEHKRHETETNAKYASEESDDEGVLDSASVDTGDGGSRRKKPLSVEARLSRMEQQNSIRERQRNAAKRALAKDSDDDDDDDDNDDDDRDSAQAARNASNRVDKRAVAVQVEIHHPEHANETKKSSTGRMNVLGSDSDSSSDGDEKAAAAKRRKGPVNLGDLKRQGVSQQVLDEITASRQAMLELQQAQLYRAHDVHLSPQEAAVLSPTNYGMHQQQQLQHHHQAILVAALQQQQQQQRQQVLFSNNGNMMAAAAMVAQNDGQTALVVAALQKQQRQHAQLINVMVRTRLERIGSAAPVLHETRLTIDSNQPCRLLQNALLQANNLTPAKAIVTMTFQGHALQLSRTPTMYGMQNGSVVDAVAQLTGLMNFSTTSSNASSAAALSAANLGREMQVTLRRQLVGKKVTEDNFSVRAKEPIQVLVDKYRAKHSLGGRATIIFKFDGDKMRLDRTPESYDMDDEDLIDVVVQ
jgi:hypothetical protein